MDLKKIIDNPYLAPLMTPLKWIGNCVALTTGPYIRAYEKAKTKKSVDNAILNYVDRVFDEAPGLVGAPIVLGGVGGLIGGVILSAKLLAGAGWVGGIMGGLALTSAVTAATAVIAPVATALAIAAATLVAATSVTTVPGILYGCKQTFDHIRGPKAAHAAAPAPAAPDLTTDQQLSALLENMTEDQKQGLLAQLQGKAAQGFGAAANTDQPELNKDITIVSPIKLKKAQP